MIGVQRYQSKEKLRHAAKLIASEVAFFNGWTVSEEAFTQSCEKAAKKVMLYLKQYERRRKP